MPATYGVDGVDEWALPFKTINDALRIRNRILALLETATEESDRRLTHVAIVGAGYSGAELAAEAHLPCRTKHTTHRATGLRANTNRIAIAVGHQDSLNFFTIVKGKQMLLSTILAFLR